MGRPCGCGSSTPRAARQVTPRRAQPDTTVAAAGAVAAGGKVFYEIWRNGRYTGRRSESIVSASATAERIGGEVRPSR